jgi:type I restriction enzyme, S subunit
MPSDWKVTRLTDLGTLGRGKSKHRPRNAAHLYGGPYPFVQTGDIKNSSGRVVAHTQTYSEAGLAQSRIWPTNTVVITIAANIAETALLTYPACFPDSVVGFVADNERSDARFIEYLFRKVRSDIQHQHVGTGSVQDNINLEILGGLEFLVPGLHEQRAIAHILGTLDDKIELNRRTSETLGAMARSLFKSWFIDFDPVAQKNRGEWRKGESLPGLPAHLYDLFPDRLVESELGEIPEGWEAGSLNDYCDLNPETWTARTRPESIMYVDLSNTKWGRIESVATYSSADAPSRAQRILHPLDTIIGTVRPGNGSYAFVSEDGLTGSTGFAVLRPKRRENAEFVYLCATSSENIEALSHLADGGAYPAVRGEVVVATPVARAHDDVVSAFSSFVAPMIASISQSERDSRKLGELRDTLLPKLISGELRVRDVERFVGDAI